MITKNQAELICHLLEENTLTIKQISDIVNCKKSIVKNILQKKAWLEVSNKYHIDDYDIKESTNGNLRLNKDIAEKICHDLSTGKYSIRDISIRYNIPYSRINDIKQRKTWKSISGKYDFSLYKTKRG